MLITEPLWVFGSVGFCIACGRKQLSGVKNLWTNRYFLVMVAKILFFFIPFESWILFSHTEWETTFFLDKGSNLLPIVATLAVFMHVTVALLTYWLNMQLLRKYGPLIVVKLSILGFGLFFSTQGMFYDTLMYSGTYDEFHSGVTKSFLSFFLTERFRDAYILFFVCFGPVFFAVALSFNEVCSHDEKKQFVQILWREVAVQGTFICLVYVLIGLSGVASHNFSLYRLPAVIFMYFVPNSTLILPFHLFLGKD